MFFKVKIKNPTVDNYYKKSRVKESEAEVGALYFRVTPETLVKARKLLNEHLGMSPQFVRSRPRHIGHPEQLALGFFISGFIPHFTIYL